MISCIKRANYGFDCNNLQTFECKRFYELIKKVEIDPTVLIKEIEAIQI